MMNDKDAAAYALEHLKRMTPAAPEVPPVERPDLDGGEWHCLHLVCTGAMDYIRRNDPKFKNYERLAKLELVDMTSTSGGMYWLTRNEKGKAVLALRWKDGNDE